MVFPKSLEEGEDQRDRHPDRPSTCGLLQIKIDLGIKLEFRFLKRTMTLTGSCLPTLTFKETAHPKKLKYASLILGRTVPLTRWPTLALFIHSLNLRRALDEQPECDEVKCFNVDEPLKRHL